VDEAGRRHALIRGEEAMTKKAPVLLDLVNDRPSFFVQTTHPPRSNELRSSSSGPLCAPIVSQICHAFAEPGGHSRAREDTAASEIE
jgi:hypothetical protein